MSKFILFMSFVVLSILLAGGLWFPDNAIMWMAATSREFAYIRILLMVSLVAMLVTDPPRNKILRAVVGVLSVTLTSWSLWETYNNQMNFLDTAAILSASISMGITALEPSQSLEQEQETVPVIA